MIDELLYKANIETLSDKIVKQLELNQKVADVEYAKELIAKEIKEKETHLATLKSNPKLLKNYVNNFFGIKYAMTQYGILKFINKNNVYSVYLYIKDLNKDGICFFVIKHTFDTKPKYKDIAKLLKPFNLETIIKIKEQQFSYKLVKREQGYITKNDFDFHIYMLKKIGKEKFIANNSWNEIYAVNTYRNCQILAFKTEEQELLDKKYPNIKNRKFSECEYPYCLKISCPHNSENNGYWGAFN